MYDSTDENVITSVNKKKSVVLTFDDGPSRVLPQILDVLKKENVPAVFFWQTRLLHPKRQWDRVMNEGHIIGTHSTKHVNLVNLSFEEQYQDIFNSVMKIEEMTGQKVTYFRPPYGQYNDDTIATAQELQLTPVMWKIASMDWELKDNPQQIITNVTEQLEDGAVILLHELRQTLEVLPELIRGIKEKGYQFTML